MSENEFEFEGVVYISSDAAEGCDGCALDERVDCYFMNRPFCYAPLRKDSKTIIFVEKQQ